MTKYLPLNGELVHEINYEINDLTITFVDFPTWIAVIVSVVVGFVIVSCCICAVRVRRW